MSFLVEDVYWRMVKSLEPKELQALQTALNARADQFENQKMTGTAYKPPPMEYPFNRLLTGVNKGDLKALIRAVSRALDEVDAEKMPKPKWVNGNKIQCIKQYRQDHDCSLKLAKHVVDHYWSENPFANVVP